MSNICTKTFNKSIDHQWRALRLFLRQKLLESRFLIIIWWYSLTWLMIWWKMQDSFLISYFLKILRVWGVQRATDNVNILLCINIGIVIHVEIYHFYHCFALNEITIFKRLQNNIIFLWIFPWNNKRLTFWPKTHDSILCVWKLIGRCIPELSCRRRRRRR